MSDLIISSNNINKGLEIKQEYILSIDLGRINFSYCLISIHDEKIIWLGEEPTMNNLYPQSKDNICRCLEYRNKNANPSSYPGTATSYKWALLNNDKIWIE